MWCDKVVVATMRSMGGRHRRTAVVGRGRIHARTYAAAAAALVLVGGVVTGCKREPESVIDDGESFGEEEGTPQSDSSSSGGEPVDAESSTGADDGPAREVPDELPPDDETTGGMDEGSTGDEPVDPGCPDCTVIADALNNGRGLAVTGVHVFWSDQNAGSVWRADKDGSEPMLLVQGADDPFELAVHGNFVYWTSFSQTGGVWRVPVMGGMAQQIVAEPWVRTITVDETYVYWGTFGTGVDDVSRLRIDLTSKPELISTFNGGVADIAIDGTGLYLTAHVTATGGGAMDPPQGTVYHLPPLPGAFPTVLETEVAEPWGIAITGDTIVWADGLGEAGTYPRSILSRPKMDALPGMPTTLTNLQTAPWAVAADATHVYWTDHDAVKSLPLDGVDVEPTVLASGQQSARYIAVDETNVYWATRKRVLTRPKD